MSKGIYPHKKKKTNTVNDLGGLKAAAEKAYAEEKAVQQKTADAQQAGMNNEYLQQATKPCWPSSPEDELSYAERAEYYGLYKAIADQINIAEEKLSCLRGNPRRYRAIRGY